MTGLPAFAMHQASFPDMYERHLVGPLFRPWANLLLDRVKLTPGDRVLDIACGTGIAARLARERLGDDARVVGVDVSAPMLDVARRMAPTVDWREGNAAALPISDNERFDVVICHQGFQFFPDKAAALQEMQRVMVPGARLGIATWRSLDDASIFGELHRVAERHVGTINDRRHSFGDAAALKKVIADAGFSSVQVETTALTIRVSDAAALLRLNTNAVIGMSEGSSTLTDADRARLAEAIVRDSADVLDAYRQDEGFAFEIGANVAIATR